MANRYIHQTIEREMVLGGIEEKEVSAFINSAVDAALKEGAGENKPIRTWPYIYLHFESMLYCSKCNKKINREGAYLGLSDNKIDEVLCDRCWNTMSEWRPKK